MMLEELQRRNYSQTTVNSYLKIVETFAKHFGRSPDQLGPEQIRSYQVYLLHERKLGVRTVGHCTAALRFFLLQNAEAGISDRRSAVSEGAATSPDHPHTRRSGPPHRFRQQSVPSRHADHALLDRYAQG